MKKEIFAIVESGSGQSVEEVERLRLEAEGLFQAVSEFQLRVLGHRHDTLH
ncbi:hypothetical protein D3C77_431190 [compost metagenome]